MKAEEVEENLEVCITKSWYPSYITALWYRRVQGGPPLGPSIKCENLSTFSTVTELVASHKIIHFSTLLN